MLFKIHNIKATRQINQNKRTFLYHLHDHIPGMHIYGH